MKGICVGRGTSYRKTLRPNLSTHACQRRLRRIRVVLALKGIETEGDESLVGFSEHMLPHELPDLQREREQPRERHGLEEVVSRRALTLALAPVALALALARHVDSSTSSK